MKSENAYQKFIRLEPFLHIFLWSVVLFYPYIKYIEREGGYMMSFAHELNALAFKMVFSYFLYFWFFPKQHKKKYVPVVILALCANASLYEFADRYFHTGNTHFWKHFTANVLTYLGFGLVFFTIYSVKKMYQHQLEVDTLLHGKKQAEMSALKAQINPHFLFNTLNTIYANALRKDDKTPDLILKLSNGFRYVLHEGQQEYVSIQQEIEHLNDYINLQQERLSSKVAVTFSTDIDDPEQQIAPLLLIPFVENAFKYTSILKGEKHPIHISMTLKNGAFLFKCDNPFNEAAKPEIEANWAASGVGVTNVVQRLELVYPKRNELTIVPKDSRYNITLSIQL